MDRDKISGILFSDWDPLDVNKIAPVDEYEQYASEIEEIMRAGGSIEDICAYLSSVRSSKLLVGLDSKKDDDTARKIMSLS